MRNKIKNIMRLLQILYMLTNQSESHRFKNKLEKLLDLVISPVAKCSLSAFAPRPRRHTPWPCSP